MAEQRDTRPFAIRKSKPGTPTPATINVEVIRGEFAAQLVVEAEARGGKRTIQKYPD
jgi:hypothetical protein